MTNNTDSKAHDRVWLRNDGEQQTWMHSPNKKHGAPYIPETPQRAAKVLLGAIKRQDPIFQSASVIKGQLRMVGEGCGLVEAWLKALSESDQ